MQSVECSVDLSSLNCINLDLMQLGHTQPQLPAPEWTDFVGPQHHSQEPKGCSSRTWEIVDKILQQITEEESNLAANQVLSRQHRNNVNVHLWGIG